VTGAADSRAQALEVRLRRALADDVDFLAALEQDPEIEPFLAGSRARTRDELLLEVERSLAEPESRGRFLIEALAEGSWRPAGTIAFEGTNRRSSIAWLGGLAVAPAWRGRGIGVASMRMLAQLLFEQLGFHRLEAEVHAFNERGAHAAESAGFVREGVKRRAYWRHDRWQDSIVLGLLVEELSDSRAQAGIS
jgi:RimJ/RimL family protein N-acetyltransferase